VEEKRKKDNREVKKVEKVRIGESEKITAEGAENAELQESNSKGGGRHFGKFEVKIYFLLVEILSCFLKKV
jgi:hypothetical protein